MNRWIEYLKLPWNNPGAVRHVLISLAVHRRVRGFYFTGENMTSALKRLAELRAMPYNEYLQTPEWRERRESAVLAAKGKCSLCNGTGDTIHVHHRTYARRGMELPSDLIALCDKCHAKHHDKINTKEPTIKELMWKAYLEGYTRAVVGAVKKKTKIGRLIKRIQAKLADKDTLSRLLNLMHQEVMDCFDAFYDECRRGGIQQDTEN